MLLISNNICAAYTLASSLVAYVTFTTAVSVSVFTVGRDKKIERETKKNMRYSKQWSTHGHIRSLLFSVGESDTRPCSRGDPESCLSV